jgi:hypothetical protein
MAFNEYFTLTTSDIGLSKHFQVLLSGYKPNLEKSQTVDKTVDGNLDISMGGLYRRNEYLVRVRQNETREGYGDLEDLRTFFSLNNPNGTPSNVITLVTHTEQVYNVVMLGSFSEQLLGVMVEGVSAWSLVLCVFQFLSVVPLEIS